MDPVVHFEIPAHDVARAQGFYGGVFGWTFTDLAPGRFSLAQTTPVDEARRPTTPANINGAILKRTAPLLHPVVTIKVTDVDRALAQVAGAGGKVVRGKADVGPVWVAYVEDTEGNVLGLVQDKP